MGRRFHLTALISNNVKSLPATLFSLICRKERKWSFTNMLRSFHQKIIRKIRLVAHCHKVLNYAMETGFDKLFEEHAKVWTHKWEECDITIEGDVAAQQGIRFNIFQLTQTYTGEDERLNIGPKGFTGEKYGGSTYWDTEAYCIPFYLGTAEQKVARNLLVYRYKHLPKAIENAKKLGFTDGAAFYPFVTMNGEECHNEWEITFEEIHRTSAMAYAIRDYIDYTGDEGYLTEYGLEVLLGISRFWAQRVNWSTDKNKYVILGVTGPNEYENNVNNNWYTNYLGAWTLTIHTKAIDYVKKPTQNDSEKSSAKINFDEKAETSKWNDIVEKMYYAEDKRRGVFFSRMVFWTKNCFVSVILSQQTVRLIRNGRGTGFFAHALSNKPMSFKVFICLKMTLTSRRYERILISMNR